MAYETKQAILEEAGLLSQATGETPVGLIDGSNRVYVVANGPLQDNNYDDVVDQNDVTVYVNGLPVAVSSINATTRAITVTVAPAIGTTVTVDYRYSPVTDAYVTKARDEAQGLIDETMASVDVTPYTTVPYTVRKMARVYAAGLLLTRDYGFNTETTGTSKDGYKKLAMVEGSGQPGTGNYKPGWLDKYLDGGGMSGGSNESDDAQVVSEPDLFSRYDHTLQDYTLDDEFMLGLQFEVEGDHLP